MNNEPQISDNGRILAIDLGAKRVGIAVSDALQMTVRGEKVITRTGDKKLRSAVVEMVTEFDAAAVVIGLPLNFDGTESASSEAARNFADFLARRVQIPIVLQDERLTSREAEQRLRERGFGFQEIQKRVDMEAAAIILEDFLSVRENHRRQTNSALFSSQIPNENSSDVPEQFS